MSEQQREWYYIEAGEQRGPILEDRFQELVQTGAIQDSTLVWHAGLGDWTAYGAAARMAASIEGAPPQVFCSVCSRHVSEDDVIRLFGGTICADCKPLYIQRLKEGARLPGQVEYAGFWIRFGAKMIDWVLVFVANTIFMQALGVLILATDNNVALYVSGQFFLAILNFLIGVAYTTYFVGRFAGTPGKLMLRLNIITGDGGRVSYLRAFGRHFAEILSGITLYVGYIIAAFDDEKRALHDHICNTRVVRA